MWKLFELYHFSEKSRDNFLYFCCVQINIYIGAIPQMAFNTSVLDGWISGG